MNFIANEVRKRMEAAETLEEKEALYFGFLDRVSPRQAESFRETYYAEEDEGERWAFMAGVEAEGIRVHVPPIFGNLDFFSFTDLYGELGIEPMRFTVWVKGRPVRPERRMIIGHQYFIRLRHDAMGKMSARSAGPLTLSQTPSKNNRRFKESQAPYSTTAVRLGEMEVIGLLALADTEELRRLVRLYSTSPKDRRNLCMRLLGAAPESRGESVFRIGTVETSDGGLNQPREILDAKLRVLGLRIDDEE